VLLVLQWPQALALGLPLVLLISQKRARVWLQFLLLLVLLQEELQVLLLV
jgi:hypothetical protein